MHTPPTRYPALESITHAPPGRLNEDAWLAMQAGRLSEIIVMAAIDGATTRLTPPPLQRYLDAQPVKLTPAAFSARYARDALARLLAENDAETLDLRALLLDANAALGQELTGIFGELTLDAMRFPPEVYATLKHDPRLVRLALPASVITLAAYDPRAHMLHYAHAGDTALIVVYGDGTVTLPTASDVPDMDQSLSKLAAQQRAYQPTLSYRELVKQPEVLRLNLNSGLRHNYVDEHGLPQPSQGVGVIDGLPELRYFVQTGSVSLENAVFAAVVTDGLLWPVSADEAFSEDPDEAAGMARRRRAYMAEQIEALGLAGYLTLLRRAEADDPDHEQYPRMKTYDDATGVLLRFAR